MGTRLGASTGISNEFVEKIEAPLTGDAVPMLALMNWLVDETEKLLNALKAAGC